MPSDSPDETRGNREVSGNEGDSVPWYSTDETYRN